ncbi:hypothetical protein HBI18_182010 [Parastagonospora nodorum]|nr:hypothetical protein HBH47_228130 [Parastagonospora nodorum]KAH4921718.1 hypothetical protein HBI79_184900 [Parastagonospora nodorum]KAH4957404.1 hypothetical protein HBI78_190420 [Parastagonospora nodorum]KAH5411708.1 hypothetical protein HBI46_160720 [Parastagonospora nodorum]KAH5490538.1 hypothetical protein HBI29_203250 [Parastagonospora nodorum]
MYIDTANANSRSARPQVSVSSRSSPYNESSTPFLEPPVDRVPPPTYLEATTPGLYSSRLSEDQGARLLGEGDREEREASNKEDQYRKRSLREQCTSRRWVRWIPAFAFILLLAVMLAAMAAAVSVRSSNQASVTNAGSVAQGSSAEKVNPPTFAHPSGAEASSSLDEGFIGEDNERPDLIAIPWPTPTPTGAKPPSPTHSRQVFPIRWPAFCGKQYNVKVDEYDFGTSKDLDIQEAVHQLDGSYKKVYGWIHVVRAPANQAPGTIQARLSYAASPRVNIGSIPHSTSANGLVIGDPTYPDGFDGLHKGSACLGMSLVVYMAAGVEIDTLKVSANHLGMQIHQGVEFTVKKSTHISLTKGTLDAAAFNSSATYLKTISGSISGLYTLSDLVSVTSKSGSVNIEVEPQAATADSSPSAIFMVDAHSSSVRTDFKRKRIPDRDYQVYINTTVGSVDGTFIHGSRTEINSVAGYVNADLLPFKSGDFASTINTDTDAGQTRIRVRTPYKAKNIPMTGLTSVHKTVSGELDLTYPQEWVGHINGTSLSGALHLEGKDLELLGENDKPQENHVEAQKGKGGGKLEFDTDSGECKIKIGKA